MSSALVSDVGVSTDVSLIHIMDFLGSAECHPEPWEKSAGMIISALFIIYLSCILARVTDMYLVPALEVLCIRLKLTQDVAGATFLSLGGSAPELVIHIIATVQGTEIGVATIVGSAIINITIGVVVVVVLSPVVIKLSIKPLVRDGSFYLFCLSFVLICFRAYDRVQIWQPIILLILYICFVTFLLTRPRLPFLDDDDSYTSAAHAHAHEHDEEKQISASSTSSSSTANQQDVYVQEHETLISNKESTDDSDSDDKHPAASSSDTMVLPSDNESRVFAHTHATVTPKSSFFEKLYFAINKPTDWVFRHTVPSCELPSQRHRYKWTVFVSLFYVILISFLLMSFVQYVGCVSGMDHALNGLIILSLASSLPDVITMGIASYRGLGIMSISGLLGSNIFDVLIGLGLPWILRFIISKKGPLVNNDRLFRSALLLLVSTVLVILSFILHEMKLKKTVAILPIVAYITWVLSESLNSSS